MAANNKSLGKFILDGIPPAPRGVPQIEVTFDINANGILEVTAQDKATGRSQNITITASSGLSEDEVENMRQEAEQHAEEDRQRRELIEARNRADNMVYSAEKTLKDLGEKVPADLQKRVEEAAEKVRQVKDGEDKEAIDQATDALAEALQQVGQAAYQQEAPSQSQGEGPQTQQGSPEGDKGQEDDEDVVDGEFKQV
jgi:molecular chaperone DnaK